MKKYLFVFLLLFSFNQAQSEGYRQLLNKDNKWNYLSEMIATCNCGEIVTFSLTLTNDTLIGDQNYSKMMCKTTSATNEGALIETDRYAAALREDIEKQIVYVRYPDQEEQILYNFNPQVGDTTLLEVSNSTWNTSKTIRFVTKIEQYNYSGMTGKKISISDTTFLSQTEYRYGQWVTYNSSYEVYSDSFYEGIGSMQSLINLKYTGNYVDELTLQLLCFWNQDNLIYHLENRTECLYAESWSGTNDIHEKNEVLYPNPTKGELNIKTTINVSLIQVFNTKGIKIHETDDKTIDLSALSNGLYFVRIQTESGAFSVHKIIIQK